MFKLEGKKALVTGASGAIGAEIARLFHKQGADVVISGTRLKPLNELQNELGDRCHILTCNLKDSEETSQLFDKAEAMVGQIDILINNAGMTKDGLLMRMKDEDWQDVIDVNLTSAFKLCRSAVKSMIKRRWGRIINISSVVGVTGNPGQVNYVASKAGMIGLAKSLAAEVASRGITVNSIAPGFIATPMTEKLNDSQKETILAKIPANRMGEATEIANAAVFLASEEAGYINGQTIHVNGGMAMI